MQAIHVLGDHMIQEFVNTYITNNVKLVISIPEKIKLLQSFKDREISKVIEQINLKVFAALESPHFNRKVAQKYFSNEKINTEDSEEPFTNFETEPDNITQIKKFINALHHARLAFIDLESVDLSSVKNYYSIVELLYYNTVHHAYMASFLITHLDIDLKDIFKDELAMIVPHLNKFIGVAEQYSDETKQITKQIISYPLNYNAGFVTGTAVVKMHPTNGSLDYNFLTDFSIKLPGYIEQFTQVVRKYSPRIIDSASKLDKEKLEELQNAGLSLLTSLEKLKGNDFYASFKFLNYIYIIQHVVTLSMSTYQQMENLTESSQDVIRDNLAQLKYVALPALFGLVDKIEVQSMLEPGTLSLPLMEQVKTLYDGLIDYASKPVNFQEKGEELLEIEDPRFLSLRLELTYNRIADAKKALFQISKEQKALTEFYKLLSDPEYRELCIHEFPKELKEKLITQYKIIRPYMVQLDVDFDKILLESLQKDDSNDSNDSYWNQVTQWFRHKLLENDNISHVFAREKELQVLIDKKSETHQFQIGLNIALIESVKEKSRLELFPYNERMNIFALDESTALTSIWTDQDLMQFFNDFFLKQKQKNDELDEIFNSIEFKQFTMKTLAEKIDFIFEKIKSKIPETKRNVFDCQYFKNAFYEQYKAKGTSKILQFSAGFTSIEATALIKAADVTHISELQFANESKRVVNTEDLSCKQALDIHQWYEGKRKQFIPAKKSYDDFMALLKNKKNKLLSIENLDKDTRIKCRNLYNDFQSYFIGAIPENERQAAIDFDKKLAHLLSGKKSDPKTDSIDLSKTIDKYDMHVQKVFAEIDSVWMKKSAFYKKEADKKHQSENTVFELECDLGQVTRAHHVLPNTCYSKFVNEFRAELFKMTSQLNLTVQNELNNFSPELPYPELESLNGTLAQSKQMVAIKRIFNALYHLEKLADRLEQLKNDDYETCYFIYLAQTYEHLYGLYNLTNELCADPYIGLLAEELMVKAQTFIACIKDQSEEYHLPSEKVAYGGSVKYNALWYVINAFHIIPEHIRTFNEDSNITAEEMELLHLNAKKATLKIDKIINSSNSYFKLFLQIPNMYSLYGELKNLLKEFSSTTHDAVMENLDKIKSKIIIPMLIEADQWEAKLGLKSGLLSGPLKTMTDEYFAGLIDAMSLNSKTYLSLICDKNPIEQRIKFANEQINTATKHLKEIEKEYEDTEAFFKQLLIYDKLTTGPVSSLYGDLFDSDLIVAYKKAVFKLTELAEQYKIESNSNQEDLKIDNLLNASTEYYQAKLPQIRALTHTVHHHYLGLKATFQMELDTAKEKLSYLNQLKKEEDKTHIAVLEKYTTESFNKIKDALCNRHIGLHYLHQEYREKLKAEVELFRNEIISKAKTAEDINLKIELLLQEKIKLFEKNNVTKYHQLDTVKAVLGKFIERLGRASTRLGKDSATNALYVKKTELINDLDGIASDTTLSIDERLQKIASEVKKPTFEGTILTHREEIFLSFNYFKQLFLSLLEALHLYTPTRRRLFNELNHAIVSEPKISDLSQRFGLFSTIDKAQNIQNELRDEPIVNTP